MGVIQKYLPSLNRINQTDGRNTITPRKSNSFMKYMRQYGIFYVFILPAFLDVLIFRYFPIYGIQIAFRDYSARAGILGSEWVGIKYFQRFLSAPNFVMLFRNTFLVSGYNLLFGFPIPIVLAIMINEIYKKSMKKIVQMITYLPHFISTVAVVGLVNLFLDRNGGIFNIFRSALGLDVVNYMAQSSSFRTIYVITEIWQHAGWGSIIFLAALLGVNAETIEAARIDGASRIQKIIYIDFPTILPTIIVLLVLRAGSILNVGFEKVFLFQNDLNRDVTEIISTYTYNAGLLNGQFSYTTAIGLFNNIINAFILVVINRIARSVSGSSLW